MKNKPHSEVDKKRRKKILLIVFLAILLVVLIIVFINNASFQSLNAQPTTTPSYLEDEGSALSGAVGTNSNEEILDELRKQQLVVTDKLSSNITFPDGEAGTIGVWIVENPSTNNIIQQAEVYLEDQLIAKTAAIYPNQHIEAIELKQDLQAGEYDVIAYINYYEVDTKALISKAGYKIHLTVR